MSDSRMQSQGEQLPAIRQTHLFRAPIEKVWKAVATSEGIAAWFMPNDFQPELGYAFHLEAGPFGSSPCKVIVLEPPRKLSFTWGKDWILTFELEERDDGHTQFTLIHDGWIADQATEFGEPHDVVRDRMSKGWSGLGQSLQNYVEQ